MEAIVTMMEREMLHFPPNNLKGKRRKKRTTGRLIVIEMDGAKTCANTTDEKER